MEGIVSNDTQVEKNKNLASKLLSGLTIICLIISACLFQWNLILQERNERLVNEIKNTRIETVNLKNAAKISDYYYRFDVATRISIINDVGEWVDHYLPKYFPEGPFTKKDFLAIAMVESSFNQYLTGRDGEYGIFQILPESSEWMGIKKNQFDVRVNTELSMFVLKKKFDEHKDYKISIIAYNGMAKKRGKLSEEYWDKFIRYRRALDDILGDTVLFEK